PLRGCGGPGRAPVSFATVAANGRWPHPPDPAPPTTLPGSRAPRRGRERAPAHGESRLWPHRADLVPYECSPDPRVRRQTPAPDVARSGRPPSLRTACPAAIVSHQASTTRRPAWDWRPEPVDN